MQVRQLVEEASAILTTLGNEAQLTVALAFPPHFLRNSPQLLNDMEREAQVVARLLRGDREAVWSMDTLQGKLAVLRGVAREEVGEIKDGKGISSRSLLLEPYL